MKINKSVKWWTMSPNFHYNYTFSQSTNITSIATTIRQILTLKLEFQYLVVTFNNFHTFHPENRNANSISTYDARERLLCNQLNQVSTIFNDAQLTTYKRQITWIENDTHFPSHTIWIYHKQIHSHALAALLLSWL